MPHTVTSATALPPASAADPTPAMGAAALIDAIACGAFHRIPDALQPDATLKALLPGGYHEWHGAEAIAGVFAGWFGDVAEYQLTEMSMGELGHRHQLRWQLRLRGARFGQHPRIVEQYAFADTAPDGRIRRLVLLCSGFLKVDLSADD